LIAFVEKNMSKKKVLIVTYYWPPSGGVGVQRWLHFSLNLQKLGFEPIVYTPSNPQFEITDEDLLKLSTQIRVVRQKIVEPFYFFKWITGKKNMKNVQQGTALEKPSKSILDHLFIWIRGNFFIPDARFLWVKPSIRFLSAYLPNNQIDTIITTGPPHSMHLIGLGLKKRIPSLKWIADFRDPWSDWDILKLLKTSGLAMKKHRALERNVLNSADRIVTVSKRMAEGLQRKRKSESPLDIIKNGVSMRISSTAAEKNPDKFIIGYFGMLNELRDPTILWETLERVCENDSNFHEKLEIRIGGIISQSIVERLEKSPYLSQGLVLLGYLPHEEVFAEYQRCDILLLLLNKTDNAKWILPVKFFEYLTARCPILTLGPKDSDLGDLLMNHKVGEVIQADDERGLEAFLIHNFRGNYHVNPKHFDALLKEHTREKQAEELAALINSL
jgi:glycosyltransferase involved in cell wall biosynthesis